LICAANARTLALAVTVVVVIVFQYDVLVNAVLAGTLCKL
jgi:hypothetical protein